MEGPLCIPPERSSLIGKAIWKTRYIVLGPDPRRSDLPTSSHSSKSGRLRTSKHSSKPSLSLKQGKSDELCFSVFKESNDPEPIVCYPLKCIQHCNIEKTSRNRYGDWIRHLVITVEPEQSSSKKSKSKSSSSGTLQSSRTRGKVLEFRNCVEGGGPTIFDWYDRLQACLSEAESSFPADLSVVPEVDSPRSRQRSPTRHKSRSRRSNALVSTGSSNSASSSRPSSKSQSRTLSPITGPDYLSSGRVHITEHIDAVSSVQDKTRKMPPQESILDRAFTLNYLPESEVSDYEVEAGQKNSVARIEALMRNSISQPIPNRPSFINIPDPIPSPTQRAIDFISERPPAQAKRRAPRPKSTFMPIMGKPLPASTAPEDDRRRSIVSVSSTQTKRTNFSDLAAQLASTSSLMLVHARNSSCGSRASLDDADSTWSEREDPMSYLSARPTRRTGFYQSQAC